MSDECICIGESKLNGSVFFLGNELNTHVKGECLAEKINICLRCECATNKQHPNSNTSCCRGNSTTE